MFLYIESTGGGGDQAWTTLEIDDNVLLQQYLQSWCDIFGGDNNHLGNNVSVIVYDTTSKTFGIAFNDCFDVRRRLRIIVENTDPTDDLFISVSMIARKVA